MSLSCRFHRAKAAKNIAKASIKPSYPTFWSGKQKTKQKWSANTRWHDTLNVISKHVKLGKGTNYPCTLLCKENKLSKRILRRNKSFLWDDKRFEIWYMMKIFMSIDFFRVVFCFKISLDKKRVQCFEPSFILKSTKALLNF